MQLHAVIDYRHFFGQKIPDAPFDKIRQYPTDSLVVILAKINTIIFVHPNDDIECDNKVLSHCFGKLPSSWLKRTNELRFEKDPVAVSICFTSQSILYLITKVISMYRPIANEDVVNEPMMQRDIFEAILIANEQYYTRADVTDASTLPAIWKLELLQQTYMRKFRDIFGILPLKFFLFFSFIEKRYGKKYIDEFANAFGLHSHFNYLFNLLSRLVEATRGFEDTGEPKWIITLEKDQELFMKPFIFDATILHEKPSTENSHRFVQKPFYAFSMGIAVLDFHFFNHLVDIGVVYNFFHHTTLKNRPEFANYSFYQAELGKYFYEEFVVVQLIRKIFTDRNDEILTDEDHPDYPDILLIQNEKDVFVIEVKSCRINARELENASTDGLELFLNKNFANEKSGVGEKNKGIYQLIKQIESLKINRIKCNVFPIIIYTEPVMDISGVNYYLQKKMDTRAETMKKEFKMMYPLTCINLDFLIRFYIEFKTNRFFLKKCITQYHKRMESNRKSFARSGHPLTFLKSNFSFMRMFEEMNPTDNIMSYFSEAATDLGFKEKAK